MTADEFVGVDVPDRADHRRVVRDATGTIAMEEVRMLSDTRGPRWTNAAGGQVNADNGRRRRGEALAKNILGP